MDVLLNEQELMLRNNAREFLEGECSPSLARAMETDDLGYPPALWDKQSRVVFDKVRVPRANLVGQLTRGWPVVQRMVERATALRAQTARSPFGAAEVDPQRGTRSFINGKWYSFCRLDCRTKFMANPRKYEN